MDSLRFFESFLAAARTGSLTAAARKMRISQPAISQQINSLEMAYGAKLLHRNRSGVQLTRPGEILFEHAEAILRKNDDLKFQLGQLTDSQAGTLKISVSFGMAQFVLGDVILDLAKSHPDLTIIITTDDRFVDLVSEGLDLAIRIGDMGSGQVVGRKIGNFAYTLVATPHYLDQFSRPHSPNDLKALNYIQYRADDGATIACMQNNEVLHAPVVSNLSAQLPSLLFQAVLSHLGFARVPLFTAVDSIENGNLEVILPKWRQSDKELFLVFPHRENHTGRAKVFLKALYARMNQTQGIELSPDLRP